MARRGALGPHRERLSVLILISPPTGDLVVRRRPGLARARGCWPPSVEPAAAPYAPLLRPTELRADPCLTCPRGPDHGAVVGPRRPPGRT